MKMTIKRKPMILAVAMLLALVTIVSATFAWFTATDEVTNRLATKDALANVFIHETFVEPDDWKPGQTITKQVAIADIGTAPALVRVSFEESLTVNLPAESEDDPYDSDMDTAGKIPVLFNNAMFTGADWFKVTTTAADASKGGIQLADDYDLEVYAKYAPAATGGGSIGSYSFAVWAEISGSGTSFDGKLQSVTYARAWDEATKTLTLSDISYLVSGKPITQTADWTSVKPADNTKSAAETLLNAVTEVVGEYPNNIQLNYGDLNAALTDDEWFYNAADGYFYYIGLVEPGTITPELLKSLLLKNTADSDYYANMVYDLTVNMDAIQHTKDAVAAKWNVSNAMNNAALLAKLESFCES